MRLIAAFERPGSDQLSIADEVQTLLAAGDRSEHTEISASMWSNINRSWH